MIPFWQDYFDIVVNARTCHVQGGAIVKFDKALLMAISRTNCMFEVFPLAE